MQIRKLSAAVLRVRLRKPFRHASAVRTYSDNIVVQTLLADGTVGWGEGVPREYVTGETAGGALEQFDQTPWAEQMAGDVNNWAEVLVLCQRLRPATVVDDPRGCHGNALRCAVELSVLDAYGKLFGQPVWRAVEQYQPAGAILSRRKQVRYSTTIDAEQGRRLRLAALKMRLYGFHHCKVKVGSQPTADARRLAIVRRWIGRHVDLRVDVNEAWTADTMVAAARALAPADLSCIEQPLPHAELAALAHLRRQVEIPVMLDESLTSEHDAREAIRLGACDLFNIRLSKCGGLLPSLRLAALAHEHGLGYQLGCHPGETGLLSAAGRHFATSVAGLFYLEGSYDRHVLARLPTTPDLTFGYGGRAPALGSPGLGARLRRGAIKRLRGLREATFGQ